MLYLSVEIESVFPDVFLGGHYHHFYMKASHASISQEDLGYNLNYWQFPASSDGTMYFLGVQLDACKKWVKRASFGMMKVTPESLNKIVQPTCSPKGF